MDLFPENVYKSFPLTITEKWKTIINDMDTGKEHRLKKWAFPKRIITLDHKVIKQSEITPLWQFYNKQGGSFKTFAFFYPTTRSWFNEYIGQGDGTTTTYNLKSKNTTNITVYGDGTVAGGYSITLGNGTDGSDTITFDNPPINGTIITYDFTGTLYLNVRFLEDNLDSELFEYMIYNTGIRMIEVK